jgi:sulfite oxidase
MTAADDHGERARRAQELADRAGAERAAADRSERLMRQESDPRLVDVHRRAAALHRQALQHYEDAAELQRIHAEHERSATRSAVPADDDERERLADLREAQADGRDHVADEREREQDDRERQQDARDDRYAEATG